MTIDTEVDLVTAEVPEEVSHRSLEKRAIKGTYFIVGFYGLALAIRFGSSIILTHLFAPELFGLMALMTTVIVGLSLFSHIGLEDSVIQNPRGDEEIFVNTAWTIQVLRGVGLWLLTIALAWPIVKFYPQIHTVWLLPLLGLCCVISGFASPKMLTMSRHLGVGRLSLLELLSQIMVFGGTWAFARFYSPTIWALLFGRVLSEVVRTIASYYIIKVGIRPRFVLERSSMKSLVQFGRWILVSTSLTFLASQSDKLVLAKLTTLQMLGVYGIAFSLSDLPRQIIQMFSSKVGFPFIAKFSQKPRPEFRQVVLKYRMLVLAVGAVMLTFTICIGDLFIKHVYDKRYHDAAWMIALFAIGLWHTLLYNTLTPGIMSLQKSEYQAIGNFFYCVALFGLLPVGFLYFGMVGAVAAVAISDLPVYVVNVYGAYRLGMGMLRQDGMMTAFFLLTLAAGLGIRHALGLQLPFPAMPHFGHP